MTRKCDVAGLLGVVGGDDVGVRAAGRPPGPRGGSARRTPDCRMQVAADDLQGDRPLHQAVLGLVDRPPCRRRRGTCRSCSADDCAARSAATARVLGLTCASGSPLSAGARVLEQGEKGTSSGISPRIWQQRRIRRCAAATASCRSASSRPHRNAVSCSRWDVPAGASSPPLGRLALQHVR